MPIDPELKKELDHIKTLIKSNPAGGLLILMFFMSCSQCNRLERIENRVNYLYNNR